MSDAAGPVGVQVREIFRDPSNADVLFLGSSLVRAAIDTPIVEKALSMRLGRPAHVEMLALNWQGMDLQYFLLRDYLKTHRAGLVLWNLPVPGSRNLEPHIEAFRWVRFGEYSDALFGLSLPYRLALYSDMVLGAPRELLAHLRPNLLSTEELELQIASQRSGYYGQPFVPELVDSVPTPTLEQSLQEPPYSLVQAAGKPLNSYEYHFAMKILELAKETHTKIVLLHIPIDSEQGLDYIPERSRWDDSLHLDAPMIGTTSDVLFNGVSKERVHNFYRDQHMNMNGSELFTRDIVPAILHVYSDKDIHE
jgi:hypothetical protein